MPALSGTFTGTVKAGSIDGKWAQPGGSFPLVLSPYQKPRISKADADIIVGTWSGPLPAPGPAPRSSCASKWATRVSCRARWRRVSEQGSGEWPMDEAEFASGRLTLQCRRPCSGEFTANYANGVLNGVWLQSRGPANGLAVVLKKGAAAGISRVLKLNGEAFVAVSGQWHGTLTMKDARGHEVAKPVSMLFEADSHADIVGFFGGEAVGPKPVPVTEASLAGGRFVAKSDALGVEYRGQVSGGTMQGEWVQGDQRVPLTFTRPVK